MDVIKFLKDVLVVAQKSNDIEMTQKVISAQEAVINMQDKITKLQSENKKLKEKKNIKNKVERYRNIPIITLKDDNSKILYCANCYDSNEKIIQLEVRGNNRCHCKTCNSFCYIDYSPDADKIRKGIDVC